MELQNQIQIIQGAIKHIQGKGTKFSEREPVAVVAQLKSLLSHLESNIEPVLDWSETQLLPYGFHVARGMNKVTESVEVEVPTNATKQQEENIVEGEYWDWAGNHAEFNWWKEY